MTDHIKIEVVEDADNTGRRSQMSRQQLEADACMESYPQVTFAASSRTLHSASSSAFSGAEEQRLCIADCVSLNSNHRMQNRDAAEEAIHILREVAETKKRRKTIRTNAHFCEFIAGELDQLAPERQRQVRKQIFDLVFKSLQES